MFIEPTFIMDKRPSYCDIDALIDSSTQAINKTMKLLIQKTRIPRRILILGLLSLVSAVAIFVLQEIVALLSLLGQSNIHSYQDLAAAENDSSPTHTTKGSPIPKGILEWNPFSTSSGLTRTLCTTQSKWYPFPTLRKMFDHHASGWKFVVEKGENACKDSLIRVLWDKKDTALEKGESKKLQDQLRQEQVRQHRRGQQLTTTVLGGYIDKGALYKLIQGSGDNPGSVLRRAIHWIWKPRDANKGSGIRVVGDNKSDGGERSCHSYCIAKTGESAQAQALTPTMLLPDGRKFDIRSHLLVASVNPLIVFSGAERVRICAEPMYKTKPRPFPDIPASTTFNPFQQVCNNGVGKKHPKWSLEKNSGSLSRAIPDNAALLRVKENINTVNAALVNLLSHRWTGEIGMFQVFGVDYLVGTDESVWLLEINAQPGFTGVLDGLSPNPWPDILRIEWEILSFLGGVTDRDENDETVSVLKEKLASLQLDTMHMLNVGEDDQMSPQR